MILTKGMILEAAAAKGWKVENRDEFIGVQLTQLQWSWWETLRGDDNDAAWYNHTYSQRTGKTCKNSSRGYAKERKVEKAFTCYIEYLAAKLNFKRVAKYFTSYDEAVKWGREELDNFNLDMVKYCD